MKQNVLLSIQGRQNYLGQEPEVIELVTQGVLEETADGWCISYEESDLTGLDGVTTSFLVEPGKITLVRRGRLSSCMVFQQGVHHESLYQTEFGALMISVCAAKVDCRLDSQGGTIDLVYGIEIEQSATGTIAYHLDVRINSQAEVQN